jgi:hypothetical protein
MAPGAPVKNISSNFLNWCRDQQHLTDLDQIKNQADELASQYLRKRIEAGKSVYSA